MSAVFESEKAANLKSAWDLTDRAFKLAQWIAFLSLLQIAAQKTNSKLIGLISFLLLVPLAALVGKAAAYPLVKRPFTKEDFRGTGFLRQTLSLILSLFAFYVISHFLEAVLSEFTKFQSLK